MSEIGYEPVSQDCVCVCVRVHVCVRGRVVVGVVVVIGGGVARTVLVLRNAAQSLASSPFGRTRRSPGPDCVDHYALHAVDHAVDLHARSALHAGRWRGTSGGSAGCASYSSGASGLRP